MAVARQRLARRHRSGATVPTSAAISRRSPRARTQPSPSVAEVAVEPADRLRVDDRATKRGEQVAISAERLDVLDADLILFATEKPRDIDALERVPTFKRLNAVAEHRAVFTDGVLTGAAYFTTPLSLA